MIERAQIIAEAMSWLGTPYHHQARVKGVGVDCVGLLVGVARAVGIVAPEFDVTGYSRQPDGTLLARLEQHAPRVDLAHMQPGDFVALQWERDPNHVGILAEYGIGGHLSIIHALVNRDGRGRVLTQRLDAHTRRQIVAAFQFPGVE